MPANDSKPTKQLVSQRQAGARRILLRASVGLASLAIGAVAGVAVTWALQGRPVIDSMADLESHIATSDQRDTATQKLHAAHNPLVAVCSQPSKQEVLGEGYIKGSISVDFKGSTTTRQRKDFLSQGGYTTVMSFLDDPTRVPLIFRDSFTAQYPVTVSEVNDFLTRARHESYVKSIDVGYTWYSGRMQDGDKAVVDTVDRWGEFTVVLADASKRDEFLKEYPEATLLDTGQTIVPDKSHAVVDPMKLIIMYKGTPALTVARQIKTEAKLPDTFPAVDLNSNDPPRSALFVDSSLRDAEDTRYISTLALLFGSEFTESQVRQILAQHPEIRSDHEILDFKYSTTSFVEVLVPKNQERCWADELQKLPEIESAFPDMAAKAM